MVYADFDIEYFLINEWNGIYEWEIGVYFYIIFTTYIYMGMNVRVFIYGSVCYTYEQL